MPRLILGELNRAQLLRLDLAGKGMNVSRALRAVGIESKIVGFVGGRVGETLQEGLLAEGFDVRFVKVQEETRQNITLLDQSRGLYTKINEPGATVAPHHVEEMEILLSEMVKHGDLVAFCGSLPPGAPANLYARLISLVHDKGGLAFLDSSGSAFRQGVAAYPYAIKPNDQEASELLALPLSSEQACRDAVKQFVAGNPKDDRNSQQKRRINLVVLTRGANGLVLGKNGNILVAKPPAVDALSPIGAGDSTLAGMLWAVQDGCDDVEIARRAVACGTAAAMQEGTGVGNRALVESLLGQIVIQ